MMTTTNNNTSIDSWLDWFQSRDSYIVINQSDQEKLFMSFSPNILKNKLYQCSNVTQ